MNNRNRTKVELTWLTAGSCTHAEWVTIQNGSFRSVPFPAGFAVLKHPQRGYMLFDTGYSSRFFTATREWPYRIYRAVTPVQYDESFSAKSQLKARFGIDAAKIETVIISHFHADHISGLKDFPNARFFCFRSAYEHIKPMSGWTALQNGFLPDLVPDDFEARVHFVDSDHEGGIHFSDGFPFESGFDLFGDGSVIAVDVSGHAEGQMGIFVATEEEEFFLCADAVWSSAAYVEHRPPHSLAGLIMSSTSDYYQSFDRICRLHRERPSIRIIPSHCREAAGMSGGGAIE